MLGLKKIPIFEAGLTHERSVFPFIKHLLCAWHLAKCFLPILSLFFTTNLQEILHPCFADEKTRAQKGQMTCPESYGF